MTERGIKRSSRISLVPSLRQPRGFILPRRSSSTLPAGESAGPCSHFMSELALFARSRPAYLSNHSMHSEWAEITAQSVAQLNERRKEGGRIVAVGSTATRTLETAAASGTLTPFRGPLTCSFNPGIRSTAWMHWSPTSTFHEVHCLYL